MIAPILLASTTVILLLAFSLMREFRLRRAFEKLLQRIFEKWRSGSNAKR